MAPQHPHTWVFHGHEDSVPRGREQGECVFIDRSVSERVSGEEDGQEVRLGPNAEDIPVGHLVQTNLQLQAVENVAIDAVHEVGGLEPGVLGLRIRRVGEEALHVLCNVPALVLVK